MSDSDLLIFEQVVRSASGSSYSILEKLGEGKNAAAYLVLADGGAKDHEGHFFALKLLKESENQASSLRFAEEMNFLQQCDHPAILKYYDSGVMEGSPRRPYVVVDYLPQTLQSLLEEDEREKKTLVEKASFALQLLASLNYLAGFNFAGRPVAHCDIKPDNVFLKGRSCVLGDFGLMQFCDGLAPQSRVVVPKQHPTPELILANTEKRSLSPKSDVYQLGLVLLQLFSDGAIALPHRDADPDLEYCAHLTQRVAELQISDQYGSQIRNLIERMLNLEVDERPAARELLDLWHRLFMDLAKISRQGPEGRVFPLVR